MLSKCTISLGILLISIPASKAAPGPVDQFLGEGRLKEGLIAYASPTDNAGRFSLAVLQALDGLERFSSGFNKLGVNPTFIEQTGLPFLRAVVPGSQPSSGQPASPQQVARLFEELRTALRTANATLAGIDAKEFAVQVNLSRVRLDLNGDGDPEESLAASLGDLLGINTGSGPADDLVVRFDSADAVWLKGYTHFLSGLLDLLLAYDWRPVWDQCAHLILLRPEPLPPIARVSTSEPGVPQLVDLIAAVHDMRLKLVDPEGLKRTHEAWKAMIGCSRTCWDRVLAESDNEKEWLPSPSQTGPGGAKVTQEQVDGWRLVLDELEAILAGKKLLPHWRMREGIGINLDKLFSSPPPLDLVLLIQGSALVPYTEEGPVSDRQTWRRLMEPFGPGFARFAIWNN